MVAVTSYSQLENQLRKIRNKALEGAGEKSSELAKEVIQRVLYDASSPESYQRTYALRDSIRDNPLESSGGSQAIIKIDHDRSMIPTSGENFQHASAWWSPWDYSGYVAKTVHDGLSGGLFGDSHAGLSARPYMDDTKKELSGGKYRKFMMEELKAMGLRVK